MTTLIRRLTIDDFDAIETVLDTRRGYQTAKMTDELHTKLKERYVKERITRVDHVFFFGYFLDDQLVAVSSLHRGGHQTDYVGGIAWTKAGVDLPKWPGTAHYASALIEMRNFAMDYLEARGLTVLWVMGPRDPSWERLIEVKGCVLSDPTRYSRETYVEINANSWSGIGFVDAFILVGQTVPIDQVVFKLTCLNPKPDPDPPRVRELELPPGAPTPRAPVKVKPRDPNAPLA